eukprot:ctg_1240.g412
MTTGCDPSLVLVVASLEQMSAAGGIGRALVHRALADDALLERLNREATGCAFLERLHARLMLEYLEGLEAKRVDGRLGWAPLFEAANVVRASHPHGMRVAALRGDGLWWAIRGAGHDTLGGVGAGGRVGERRRRGPETPARAAAAASAFTTLGRRRANGGQRASRRAASAVDRRGAETGAPGAVSALGDELGADAISAEARSPMLQALGIVEGAERTATHNETTETAVETPVLSVTKPARKVAAGAKAAGKRARRRTVAAQCAAPTEDVDVSPNKRPCVRRTTAARSPKTRAANVDTVSSSSSSDDQRPEASRGNRRAGGGLMRRLLQPSAVAADRSDLWHEDANVGGIAQTPTAKTAAAPPRRVRAAVNVPDAVPSPEPSPASTVSGSESARKRHFCRYSSAEDAALLEGLQQCGIGHWKLILQRIGSRLHPSHRSTSSLRDRVRQLGWRREDFPIPNALLDEIRSGGEINALGRVRFTAVEDEALRRGLQHYGWGAWKTILQHGAFHPRRNWRALKDRARHLQRSMPGFPLMADGVNAS